MTPAGFIGEAVIKRRGRGLAKATLDLIATCREIIEQVKPITVRGVCYRLFVAGHIDSMEVRNTQKISRLLVAAREEGSIPWEWIVDDSRRMEGDGGFTNLEAYARIIEQAYRRDFWAHQDRRVTVISEKAAVAGDFTMLENEVAPVIKTLIENGIEVVAVHNHMVHETPKIFFLHYWGVGPAGKLAKGLRAALDQTGKPTSH